MASNTSSPQQKKLPNKLYLSSLPSNVDERCLKSHFGKYGNLESIHLTKDSVKGFCKGFGSIKFAPNVDVGVVLSHEHSLFGRSIMCELFIENKKDLEMRKNLLTKKRIFISNIPNWMSNNALTQALGRFGRVQSAYRIQKHDTKSQMPYGYVCFEDQDSVQRCLDKAFLFMGNESGFMLFEQYTKDKRERLRKRKQRDKKIRNFKKNLKNEKKRNNDFYHRGSLEFGSDSLRQVSNMRTLIEISGDAQLDEQFIHQNQNSRSGSGVFGQQIPKKIGNYKNESLKKKRKDKKSRRQRNKMGKKKDTEVLKRQLQFNLLKPNDAEYWKFSLKRTKYFQLRVNDNYLFNKA